MRFGRTQGRIDLGDFSITNLKAEISAIKQDDLKFIKEELRELSKEVQNLMSNITLHTHILSENKDQISAIHDRLRDIDYSINDIRRRLNGYNPDRDHPGSSRSLNP